MAAKLSINGAGWETVVTPAGGPGREGKEEERGRRREKREKRGGGSSVLLEFANSPPKHTFQPI